MISRETGTKKKVAGKPNSSLFHCNKAKGYRGSRSKLYRYAKDAVMKAQSWAYRDRKNRKRTFRSLWVQRINAAVRERGLSYSRFMEGLKASNVELDRKVLSDIAIHDSAAFDEIVAQAKAGLDSKAKAAS